MCKINFYLKGVPSAQNLEVLKANNFRKYNEEIEKLRPIILSVFNHGTRHLISTGKFIALKNWQQTSQTIKNSVNSTQESLEDRIWLNSKKTEIEKFIIKSNSDKKNVSKGDISKILERVENKKANGSDTLLDKLDYFLSKYKTKKGTPIKDRTKQKFNTLVKTHWLAFQNNDLRFYPEKYDLSWVDEFKNYIINKGCNDNTLNKYIEALRTFLRFFMDEGENIQINLSKIKTYEFEQEINILKNEELMHLESFLFDKRCLEQVRDIFVFQCHTGARYSDIESIANEDIIIINGKKCWSYISKKMNDQKIVVPITMTASKILDKYKDLPTPLPRLTLKTVNETLKDLAKIAGLSRTVKKVTFSNGKMTEKYYPLHNIISSHMARKTFISLSLQKRIPEVFVKAVSGHKDDKSFRRYVNLANQHLDAVLEAWDKSFPS